MIRVLRTIRTVILVAIALVVLAAVGLFGWWTAIAPDCRSIWGNPDARCIAARLPWPDRRPRCPLHLRRHLNSLAPAQRPLPSGGAGELVGRLDHGGGRFPEELGGGLLDRPVSTSR